MVMKIAVGYQLPDAENGSFADIIGGFIGSVEEVYFPWLDQPSGRAIMTVHEGCVNWGGQDVLERDLHYLKSQHIKLNLLLNANCYGPQSLSVHFKNCICSLIDYLCETTGLDVVTTTSLFVASTVKKHFSGLDVRASVNMRIGTVNAMKMVATCFDSFYLQREFNRDFARIAEMKNWAENNGKKLHILANSGCINFCPGQIFHDNLVAHEREISGMRNVADWNPCVCWNYLPEQNNWPVLLQNSWIRPEDLVFYEQLFPWVKLSTRMHANPKRVIRAYQDRKFVGNLLDLFEPGFASILHPHIIDNSRFPSDWFEQVTSCDRNCHSCDYCENVLKEVLVKI